MVIAPDGVEISVARTGTGTGTGTALVVVDAAGNHSGFRPLSAPVDLLAEHFSVFVYDRRGRGHSGDAEPYTVEKEIGDLAAVIDAAGGSAYLYGMSSGCLLAVHAAAAGLPVPKIALFEPPLSFTPDPAFTAAVRDVLASRGKRATVEFFNRAIGVPDDLIAAMPPEAWSVGHTLVYDCLLLETASPELLGAVRVPALVLDSTGSAGPLTDMAKLAADHLPAATRRTLPGEWHGVAGEALAPVLRTYFLE
ncbi:alpha/beta fold hydrolase [Herbidospora mongoliensis]|uniref:alpha/beta fold hydrolase n=1 Tax=Herbidospora mongoliensis TaxID=688067 RepID=UPI000832B88A|nr:alpha/beta hydrolase [Herbidospora mongoliensis]